MSKRGIVLVSVLFFILLVGMIARVILINGPAMARLGGQAQEELLAERAAEAGAVYARARFRELADWKGNLNAVTINEPDFQVVEDQGNVIGWLVNAGGQVSMFRIRFNWQDGAGGGDFLQDPSPQHFIDHRYISVNNIRSKVDKPLPRSQIGGAWAVTSPRSGLKAPKGSAVIEVEGLCGAAVSSTTGPDSPRGPGYLKRRVLRVVYAASAEPTAPDAAVSAGDGIRFEGPLNCTVDTIGTAIAKLRSKQGLSVVHADNSPNSLNMTGQIGHNPGLPVNGTLSANVTQYAETVGDGRDFANVRWSDVPQSSSDPTQAVQIPGGIYVVQADGTFLYYDMDAASYQALVPDATTGVRPGGLPLSPDWQEVRPPTNLALGGLTVDNNTKMLEVTQDLHVNTSVNGVQDFIITPVQGRKLHKADTTSPYRFLPGNANFSYGSLHLKDSVLSGSRDVAVLLNLQGENGTVVSARNAVVAAPGINFMVNATDGNGNVIPVSQRLSIYAKNDLALSTDMYFPGIRIFIPPMPWIGFPGINFNIPPYDGYAPLHLEGLVYAWGNIDLYAGTPGQDIGPPVPFWGYGLGVVTIKGALVAYGADPATTSPGSAGTGHANIYAMLAVVTYDATKLVSDPSQITATGVKSIMQVSFGYESD